MELINILPIFAAFSWLYIIGFWKLQKRYRLWRRPAYLKLWEARLAELAY